MRVCYVGGCGRLGLALACWAAEKGHQVIAADTNEDMVEAVNRGKVDTIEPRVSELVAKHSGKNLVATTDTKRAVEKSDVILVIVPTPSDNQGRFVLDYVLSACDDIRKGLSPDKAVVIMSTVMPGSMDGPIRDALGECKLAYSPEFIRQGKIIEDHANPDFIIVGGDDCDYLVELAENNPPVFRMSAVSAEIAKIGLNAAVVSKLTVANQLAWLCHKVPGADAQDVLDVIGEDRRIGHDYFSAGPWTGGPCFPRDVRALVAAGEEFDTWLLPMIAVNDYRYQQIAMLAHELREYDTVGILGIAYKPGVDIVEESQGLALAELLDDVVLHDPITQDDPLELEEVVELCDVLVLMTCHPEYKRLEQMDLSDTDVFDMWGFLDIECTRLGKCSST